MSKKGVSGTHKPKSISAIQSKCSRSPFFKELPDFENRKFVSSKHELFFVRIASPPSPLPSRSKSACPKFDLTTALTAKLASVPVRNPSHPMLPVHAPSSQTAVISSKVINDDGHQESTGQILPRVSLCLGVTLHAQRAIPPCRVPLTWKKLTLVSGRIRVPCSRSFRLTPWGGKEGPQLLPDDGRRREDVSCGRLCNRSNWGRDSLICLP
ncbi:hypothetical protein M501DRAFT_996232 [Patellaria atrata CBS 101060]|uniref:Uncharacterized protein n=1 Tax=Patellaria atrata CBS 101060 TaxID=1346257 RepID=A0A9P4S8M8_9PEZI|nr:hypothetical protein M501DRAFT_996232 [Patellaria atrata CBS 101060]